MGGGGGVGVITNKIICLFQHVYTYNLGVLYT